MSNIVLDVPESLVVAAGRLASLAGQSVESVLLASLEQGLPALTDLTPEEAAELAPLALLDDAALWGEARAVLSNEDQQAIHRLLDRQNAGLLSAKECARLESLLERYQRITLRKAQAYVLLARRGYRIAPLDS